MRQIDSTDPKAPIIVCDRHRIGCDGQGITTLVVFRGCPLRCRYCINPFTFAPDTKARDMTPAQLYEKVKIDDLYFLATGGGITLGGGEPLLYPDFIRAFLAECPEQWHICVETSLSVPWENVAKVAELVDVFYIDCKDADPEIYHRYTGADNRLMLENVEKLLTVIPPERIIMRLPLIPSFNTQEDRAKSRAVFEKIGITQFDEFTYQLP